ncbi:hypothetical protein [Acetobacterium sp.]|uniref:hypothetical protein n=1 Tax=Acetobacterium sp. TaxID=1872094 RepID=UPI00359440AD
MKIAKLVIGIVSMVLSIFVLFQSCAAGLVNTIEGSGGFSGTTGVIVAACFIIAGIVGLVTRNSYRAGGGLTAAGFYLVAALLGGTMAGNYSDLYIWAFLSWAFGVFYLVDAFYDEDEWEEVSWWQKSWLIILAMIVFPPAGIALLWFSRQFIVIPKIIMTVIFSLGFLIILANLGGFFTSAPGAASSTADDNATTPSATTEEPEKTTEPENKVYGLGETWTVDGQFALTFTGASLTADRNQFSEKTPAQVVILTYDYVNIGVEKNFMELYISSNDFKVIDATGVMADTYPASTTGNPQETPIGAKTVGAQTAYGLVNASGEITVNVEVLGNNYKSYDATFKLPVS